MGSPHFFSQYTILDGFYQDKIVKKLAKEIAQIIVPMIAYAKPIVEALEKAGTSRRNCIWK